jgi:hypothetical protein
MPPEDRDIRPAFFPAAATLPVIHLQARITKPFGPAHHMLNGAKPDFPHFSD